jgi:acylphosphatase
MFAPAYRWPMIRKQVRYTGRVQGVGFRAAARGVARLHPVTGWVRNEADGSVVMEVQGSASAVEAVLAGITDRMRRNIVNAAMLEATVVEGESEFEIAF